MPKKPVKVVIVEEREERYILRTFADGEEKQAHHHLPRKAERGAGLQGLHRLAADHFVALHAQGL